MLHNRFAGDIMDKIKKLADAGIEMNAQIVLCKGVNDGEELERSIRELYDYYPQMQSMSVVPVGLSKYRDGLYPLEPFERDDARDGGHYLRTCPAGSFKSGGLWWWTL
jgi:NifB/MoaA-like Fe-S oxidoreductase